MGVTISGVLTEPLVAFAKEVIDYLGIQESIESIHFVRHLGTEEQPIYGVYDPRLKRIRIKVNTPDILNTIAHEIRHAWQYEQGLVERNWLSYQVMNCESLAYYTSWTEVDANVFAHWYTTEKDFAPMPVVPKDKEIESVSNQVTIDRLIERFKTMHRYTAQ